MSSHLVPARVSRAELDRLGVEVKIDDAKLRAELDSGRARAIVERDAAEARRIGVATAGSVAVNGLPMAPPQSGVLETLVTNELDAGVLERLRRR
jgi:hypothetical protein